MTRGILLEKINRRDQSPIRSWHVAYLTPDIRTHVQKVALGYIVPWTTPGQGGNWWWTKNVANSKFVHGSCPCEEVLYKTGHPYTWGLSIKKIVGRPQTLRKFQMCFSIRVNKLDHMFLFRGMSENQVSLPQLLTKHLTSNNGYGR